MAQSWGNFRDGWARNLRELVDNVGFWERRYRNAIAEKDRVTLIPERAETRESMARQLARANDLVEMVDQERQALKTDLARHPRNAAMRIT